VVAEGVETKEQLSQLNQLDCEYIQGKLISMPVDESGIVELLKKEQKRSESRLV
jgi:EAL domain-containing protein (putative c-di-GMP-specific phosphodiesterase class I)